MFVELEPEREVALALTAPDLKGKKHCTVQLETANVYYTYFKHSIKLIFKI
jgi:hypothetical protein